MELMPGYEWQLVCMQALTFSWLCVCEHRRLLEKVMYNSRLAFTQCGTAMHQNGAACLMVSNCLIQQPQLLTTDGHQKMKLLLWSCVVHDI
jgi:hypothetical protein